MNDESDEMDINSTFDLPNMSQEEDGSQMEVYNLLSESQKRLFTPDDTFRIDEEFEIFFNEEGKSDVNEEFLNYFNENLNENINSMVSRGTEDTNIVQVGIEDDDAQTIERGETEDLEEQNTEQERQNSQISKMVCKYCTESFHYELAHLKRKQSCLNKYLEENGFDERHWEAERKRKKRRLQNSQISKMVCKYCAESFNYELAHLKRKQSCLNKYLEENGFDERNWEAERKQKQRGLMSSRQSCRRQEETERRTSRITDPSNFHHHVNEKIIASAHKMICCICDSMVALNNATFIDSNSSNQPKHKYENGCCLCQNCRSGKTQQRIERNQQIFFKEQEFKEVKMIIPMQERSETEDSVIGNENILLPVNGRALFRYENLEFYQDNYMCQNLNSAPSNLEMKSLPLATYMNQITKIKNAFEASEIQLGKILNNQNNSIKITKNIPSCDKVKSTEDYDQRYIEELKNKFIYTGKLCIKANVDCGFPNLSSFLYALIQQNQKQVQFVPEKVIHSSHNRAETCNEFCQKLKILDAYKDYDKSALSNGSSLHTQASFLQDWFNITTDSLRKTFGSNDFSSMLSFREKHVTLQAFIWPEEFKKINEKLANDEKLSLQDEENVIRFIEKNFAATTDLEGLQEAFNLPLGKAEQIIEKAKTTQVTQSFHFPSNFTMLSINVSQHHGQAFLSLRKQFKVLIESMEEDRKSLNDFFRAIESHEDFQIYEDVTHLNLKLPCFNIITLPRIQKYESLKNNGISKLSAIYHTSICTSTKGLEIIQKRKQLSDSKIDSYHPLLMDDEHQEIILIGTNHQTLVQESILRNTEVPEEFIDDHAMFTAIESIFIMDPQKTCVSRGNPPISVNTSENRSRSFKKATEISETNYTDISTGIQYVLLEDSYEKYIAREGNESLCFAEFLSCYNIKNSKNEVTEEIPENSNMTLSVCSCEGNSVLPKFIVTNSGKKIPIQRLRRPLLIRNKSVESNSDENKYSDVKLYIAHKDPHYIIENFRTLFYQICCEKTKIKTIKRQVFPCYDEKFEQQFY